MRATIQKIFDYENLIDDLLRDYALKKTATRFSVSSSRFQNSLERTHPNEKRFIQLQL